MSWNYRVVEVRDGDEQYYEIREVYYNSDGSLLGHCEATAASDSVEGLNEVLDMMRDALTQQVLFSSEFQRGN